MIVIKDLCGATASLLWPLAPQTCLRVLAWAGDGQDLVRPSAYRHVGSR
jgi:hypothetical protein